MAFLNIFILFNFYFSIVYSRSDIATLKRGGKNVESFLETRTVYTTVTTKVSEVRQIEECCKHFVLCWRKCKRSQVYTKLVTRQVGVQQEVWVHYCKNRWTVQRNNDTQCTKPVCDPYCRNRGKCVSPNKCTCAGTGYHGDYCQIDTNECLNKLTCEKDCLNLPGGYQCSCPRGFTPTHYQSKTCQDVNECLRTPCACQHSNDPSTCGAKCVNTIGSFKCQCGPNFKLANNGKCIDSNECLENPDICPQQCVNTLGGFRCQCFSGYEWNQAKKRCQPKHVCGLENGGCDHNCIPIFSGAVCTCKKGFVLAPDRHQCKDINECQLLNPCDARTSSCVNIRGSYACKCKLGFIKSDDRQYCHDRNECDDVTHECQQTCYNTVGSYACGCRHGYKLNADGKTCDDVDECQEGIDQCSQQCVNIPGSFHCLCREGFLLDADAKTCHAKTCEELTDPYFGKVSCKGQRVGEACLFTCNQGFVLDGPNKRVCQTDKRWSGTEAKCLPKSCPGVPVPPENSVIRLPCESTYGSRCPVVCSDGFSLVGDGFVSCQLINGRVRWKHDSICKDTNICAPNPCSNGGSCANNRCNCLDTGYTGTFCEKTYIEVSKVPKTSTNNTVKLKISSKSKERVTISILTLDPDLVVSPDAVTLNSGHSSAPISCRSATNGVKWISFHTEATTQVEHINDTALFFQDDKSVRSISVSQFLSLAPKGHQLSNELIKGVRFASLSSWQQTESIPSSEGPVFLSVWEKYFPAFITQTNDFFETIEGRFNTEPSYLGQIDFNNSQLLYAIKHDVFSKAFLRQFNQILPSWFQVSSRPLQHMHIDNLRTHLWTSRQVSRYDICRKINVASDSHYLIYLQREHLQVNSNSKVTELGTKDVFCLLLDLQTGGSHVAFPDDVSAEQLSSVIGLQKVNGWTVSAETIGFHDNQVVLQRASLEYASQSLNVSMHGKLFLPSDGLKDFERTSGTFMGGFQFSTGDFTITEQTKSLRFNFSNNKGSAETLFTLLVKDSNLKIDFGSLPLFLQSGDARFHFHYNKGNNKPVNLQQALTTFEDFSYAVDALAVASDYPEFQAIPQQIRDWYSDVENDVINAYNDITTIMVAVRRHFEKTPVIVALIEKHIESLNKADRLVIEEMRTSIREVLKYHTQLEIYVKTNSYLKHIEMEVPAKVCFLKPCLKYSAVRISLRSDQKFNILDATGMFGIDQSIGPFFSVNKTDTFQFQISKQLGFHKMKFNGSLNLFDRQKYSTWTIDDKTMAIDIPAHELGLFNNYKFLVNGSVDMRLKSFLSSTIKTRGVSLGGSLFDDIQRQVESMISDQIFALEGRIKNANSVSHKQLSEIENHLTVQEKQLLESRQISTTETDKMLRLKTDFNRYKRLYDSQRVVINKVVAKATRMCKTKACEYVCVNHQQCKVCQEAIYVNRTLLECKKTQETRWYGVMKTKQTTCSHLVTDRRLKYSGSCREPTAEPTYASYVINKIKGKVQRCEKLTLRDATLLESVEKEAGKKLRKEIEKARFFEMLSYKIRNGLMLESDYERIREYNGRAFAEKMRKNAKDMENARIVKEISLKISSGQNLPEEDYMKLKKIDPQLSKKLRKTHAVVEIQRKIKEFGHIEEADLKILKQVAPEYAEELTRNLKSRVDLQNAMKTIEEKMANGSFSKKDLEKLEEINPEIANKIKDVLKTQLTQKVKEVESKMKTVKSSLDLKFNDSNLNSLHQQLTKLTSSTQKYDKHSVQKLKEKIEESDNSKGSTFEETIERLQLGLEVKRLTGSKTDFDRVLVAYFRTIAGIDTQALLRRRFRESYNGLKNIQRWFETAGRIMHMVFETNNDQLVKSMLDVLKKELGAFAARTCNTKNTILNQVCQQISDILTLNKRVALVSATRGVVKSWVAIRVEMGFLSKELWENHLATSQLLNAYKRFTANLMSFYRNTLYGKTMDFVSVDELRELVDKQLTAETSTVSLAHYTVLREVMKRIAGGIETLPNKLKLAKVVRIRTRSTSTSVLKNYKEILNQVAVVLKTLCQDKKVSSQTVLLENIIAKNEASLTRFLKAKSSSQLATPVRELTSYLKEIIINMDSIKDSMMPCNLKEDLEDSGEYFNELNAMLRNTHFLEPNSVLSKKKTIDAVINQLNGLSTPVGKITDLMRDFANESPKFNLAMMLSSTSETARVSLNSFDGYLLSAADIYAGVVELLKRCDRCQPEEVFGKEALQQMSLELDQNLTPIAETSRKFTKLLGDIEPSGMSILLDSIELCRATLISQSETGFTTKGVQSIVEAFVGTAAAVKRLRDDARENHRLVGGTSNVDIKRQMQLLIEINKLVARFSQRSQKPAKINELYTKTEAAIADMSVSNDEQTAVASRIQVVKNSARVVEKVVDHLTFFYSAPEDDNVVNFVETEYVRQMAAKLDEVNENSIKIFNDTKEMSSLFDPSEQLDFNLSSLVGVKIAPLVNGLVNTVDEKKSSVANYIASTVKSTTSKMEEFSNRTEAFIDSFMGGISKVEDQFERMEKKLKYYEDIYDEVTTTLDKVGNISLSQIGAIKNSADKLVESIENYDFAKILTASPDVVPRKVNEVRKLFESSGSAFNEIYKTLKNCTHCNVGKVIGNKYLASLVNNVKLSFEKGFGKLEALGKTIGAAHNEVQIVVNASISIKDRFSKIYNNGISANSLKELSNAFHLSTSNVDAISIGAKNIAKLLLNKDVDIQIISGSVNKILEQLSAVLNSSADVAQKGDKLYKKAQILKTDLEVVSQSFFNDSKSPIETRIEIVRTLTESSRSFLFEVPILFNSTSKLMKREWLNRMGDHVFSLTNSLQNVILKTENVLDAADIATKGYRNATVDLLETRKAFKNLYNVDWDQKIPAFQNVTKRINVVFDEMMNTAIEVANVFNKSMTKNDLLDMLQTTIGKERVEKYTSLYKNISLVMVNLQKGPIASIGELTDSVNEFVDGLEGFDFRAVFLSKPSTLRLKLAEFQQLTRSGASILEQIVNVTGLCGECEKTILGDGFVTGVVARMESKFKNMSATAGNIFSRVDSGLQGWGVVLSAAKKVFNNFNNTIDGNVESSLHKLSKAMLTSADDLEVLQNGSTIIFKTLFDGREEMKFLENGFNKLVNKVSFAFEKSSKVLPKVSAVYTHIEKTKRLLNEIRNDVSQVTSGPIESRLLVLKEVSRGVDNIRQILPQMFNQSHDILADNGVNSSWFNDVCGHVFDVSGWLGKTVEKTNIILEGAGLVVADVREMQSIASSIGEDFGMIVNATWKEKFKLFDGTLKKVTSLVDSTDSIVGNIYTTVHNVTEMEEVGGEKTFNTITKKVRGVIGNVSRAVKKASAIHKDITKTIEEIKQGPVQKVGALIDSTKDFVKSLENYNVQEILLLSPKFAKEKLGNVKEIVISSIGIFKRMGNLVKAHCQKCNFTSIFGRHFTKNITDQLTVGLETFTRNSEAWLGDVDSGAQSMVGILSSISEIKSAASQLKEFEFDEEGFDKLSEVLVAASDSLDVIRNESSNIFSLLFNEDSDIRYLTSSYDSFLGKISGHLDEAGNFSIEVSDAFEEFSSLKTSFSVTREGIYNLTRGPLESRINAVQNIVKGMNKLMTGFPAIIRRFPSSHRLRGFQSSVDHVTSGISRVLNKTGRFAVGVGETLGGIRNIQATTTLISSNFRKIISARSAKERIQRSLSVVSKLKSFTDQVNGVASNVSSLIERTTGHTLFKTSVFGNATSKLLSGVSSGLGIIANRYDKFKEISKSVTQAFKNIKKDPVNFALHDLPIVFNQTATFINVILGDVESVASKFGVELNKYNIDSKLTRTSQRFFKFANGALSTLHSGKLLISDFNSLVKSNSFKEAMVSFHNMVNSGQVFIQNMDELGGLLFKQWGKIKGSFLSTLNTVTKSLGVNLEGMSSMFAQGINVGGNVLKIASNFETLFNLTEFNIDTVVEVAGATTNIAEAGIDLLSDFGVDVSEERMEQINHAVKMISGGIQIYRGIRMFVSWYDDICDITYRVEKKQKELTYVCDRQCLVKQSVSVDIEKCTQKHAQVLKGYKQAHACCSKSICVYMQNSSCLQQNEACIVKRDALLKTIGTGSTLIKRKVFIFDKYEKLKQNISLIDRKLKTMSVRLAQQHLRVNQLKAMKTRYGLQVKENNEKVKSINRELSKFKKIRSSLVVRKVTFNHSSRSPQLTQLMLAVQAHSKAGRDTTLHISVDIKQTDTSLSHIARTVVDRFTRIDSPGYSLPDHSTECTTFEENMQYLKGTLTSLDSELKNAESGEIEDITLRWKLDWITSTCIQFSDCLSDLLDRIIDILPPNNQHMVIGKIRRLEYELTILTTTPKIDLQKAKVLISSCISSVIFIKENVHFCDEPVHLSKDMPVSKGAYIGEPFELECTVTGPSDMEYTWFKNGVEVADQSLWKLTLSDVTADDEGYYQCQGGGTLLKTVVSNKVMVRVFKSVEIGTSPASIASTERGQIVAFACNTNAGDDAKIKWMFRPYTAAKATQISSKSFIEPQVSSTTVGQYWCEMDNGFEKFRSKPGQLDLIKSTPKRFVVAIKLNSSCEISEKMSKFHFSKQTAGDFNITITEDKKGPTNFDILVYVYTKITTGKTSSDATLALKSSQQQKSLQVAIDDFIESLQTLVFEEGCPVSFLSRTAVRIQCPKGMQVDQNNIKCAECTPGSFEFNGQCSKCPMGSYQSSNGQTTCEPCPVGTFTTAGGSPSIHDCSKQEYKCNIPNHIVMAFYSDNPTTSLAFKSFALRFATHLPNSRISLITFGENSRLIADAEALPTVAETLRRLNIIGGYNDMESSLKLAEKLLVGESDQKTLVYFTTEGLLVDKEIDKSLNALKDKDVNIFAFVVGDKDDSNTFVSEPASQHLFSVEKASEMLRWHSVVAQRVCYG